MMAQVSSRFGWILVLVPIVGLLIALKPYIETWQAAAKFLSLVAFTISLFRFDVFGDRTGDSSAACSKIAARMLGHMVWRARRVQKFHPEIFTRENENKTSPVCYLR